MSSVLVSLHLQNGDNLNYFTDLLGRAKNRLDISRFAQVLVHRDCSVYITLSVGSVTNLFTDLGQQITLCLRAPVFSFTKVSSEINI